MARLPVAERKEWQALWADVDSLQSRAATPIPTETKTSRTGPLAQHDVKADSLEVLESLHRRAHELAPSKPAEAEPLFRQVLEGYRKAQGPNGASDDPGGPTSWSVGLDDTGEGGSRADCASGGTVRGSSNSRSGPVARAERNLRGTESDPIGGQSPLRQKTDPDRSVVVRMVASRRLAATTAHFGYRATPTPSDGCHPKELGDLPKYPSSWDLRRQP
jgi:hypothetical protein